MTGLGLIDVQGDIAEVIALTGTVAADLASLEMYAKGKYGLQSTVFVRRRLRCGLGLGTRWAQRSGRR
jgi:hypothetical protein